MDINEGIGFCEYCRTEYIFEEGHICDEQLCNKEAK